MEQCDTCGNGISEIDPVYSTVTSDGEKYGCVCEECVDFDDEDFVYIEDIATGEVIRDLL